MTTPVLCPLGVHSLATGSFGAERCPLHGVELDQAGLASTRDRERQVPSLRNLPGSRRATILPREGAHEQEWSSPCTPPQLLLAHRVPAGVLTGWDPGSPALGLLPRAEFIHFRQQVYVWLGFF